MRWHDEKQTFDLAKNSADAEANAERCALAKTAELPDALPVRLVLNRSATCAAINPNYHR
jgi:hypothetical protein